MTSSSRQRGVSRRDFFGGAAAGLMLSVLDTHTMEGEMTAAVSDYSAAGTEFRNPVIEIHQGPLKVTLDAKFPRVLSYDIEGRGRLLGARVENDLLIELNGRVFSTGDFTVKYAAGVSTVDYTITIAPARLRLALRFEANPGELLMKLTAVEEQGEFKLVTLNFPGHELVRVSANNPTASMYRSEYYRSSWKDKAYKGGYDQPRPFFSSAIGEEDGEQYPQLGNWVSASTDGITATVATNIPYWKIRTQFLGFDARATDFAFWLGTYHYRLRGAVQPLLEARIALLTKDANGDGRVDWMEAALWQRELLGNPDPVFEPSTFSYKVMNEFVDQPGRQPSTTFDETLQLIERISVITGNAKQIAAVTGWQNKGMDSGWPYFDRVNEALGGLTKLQWLAREAKKHNAIISYHINIDDSNANTPGFERSIPVLADGRDGKPYPWSIYYPNGPQVYRISHTKDLESGFFEERVGAMLKLVPETNSIQLDTFRPFSISFGPGEEIGLVDEVVSSIRIVEWFHQKGLAVSSEGPVDGLYGVLDACYHLFVRTDPFHILMTHGKLYGGGKYTKGPGQVLGWSHDLDFVARVLEWNEPRFDIHMRWDPPTDDELRDIYYLGNLSQSYLMSKHLVWLGEETSTSSPSAATSTSDAPQASYVGRFDDGTVSRVSASGHWTVIDGGIVTIDGDFRAIPRSDSEILLYSATSRRVNVQIPRAWRGKPLSLFEVEKAQAHPIQAPEGLSSVAVELPPRVAYLLRPGQ